MTAYRFFFVILLASLGLFLLNFHPSIFSFIAGISAIACALLALAGRN